MEWFKLEIKCENSSSQQNYLVYLHMYVWIQNQLRVLVQAKNSKFHVMQWAIANGNIIRTDCNWWKTNQQVETTTSILLDVFVKDSMTLSILG